MVIKMKSKLNQVNNKFNKKYPFAKILDYADREDAPLEIQELIKAAFEAMNNKIERLSENDPVIAEAWRKWKEIDDRDKAIEIYVNMVKRFAICKDFTSALQTVFFLPEN
jgi:hypothetical protein